MMFENMILRPFEKIRMIRTQYHMTQSDLAGTTISRQLIGYIEKGQNDLSRDTAIKIENNLKEYFKNKGIEDPGITADLLIESEDKQIKKIVSRYIDELSFAKDTNIFSSFAKIQEEIKVVYNEYNKINNAKFIDIIKILCESSLYMGKWEEAKVYILAGLDKSSYFCNYNDMLIFYSWSTVVGIGLREYKGIIPIYNHAVEVYEKYSLQDNETLAKLTINVALAYRYLEKDIECVHYLTIAKNLTIDSKNKFKIYNLMGKSLLALKRYDEAESNLLTALEYAKSTSSNNNVIDLSIVLENLSMLYLETNRIQEAEKYIDRIEQVVENITNEHQKARYLYYLAVIEIMKDESKDKVKSLCNRVINLAAKFKDKFLIYRISYESCKYLICKDDIQGLEQLADNIYIVSLESSIIHERMPNVLYTIAEHIEESNEYEDIRKRVSKYAYTLERQICHEESFEI